MQYIKKILELIINNKIYNHIYFLITFLIATYIVINYFSKRIKQIVKKGYIGDITSTFNKTKRGDN